MSALNSFDLRAVRGAALAVAIVGAATIAGAWIFQAYGYAPCKLCYEQRYAYYVGVPLSLATAILAGPQPKFARTLIVAVGLIFIANAVFGVYHAGVEWSWWPGPTDCSPAGGAGALPGQAGSLLQQMQTARVVNCSEAALRIFGLSLAGWNAAICAALAAVALRAAARG